MTLHKGNSLPLSKQGHVEREIFSCVSKPKYFVTENETTNTYKMSLKVRRVTGQEPVIWKRPNQYFGAVFGRRGEFSYEENLVSQELNPNLQQVLGSRKAKQTVDSGSPERLGWRSMGSPIPKRRQFSPALQTLTGQWGEHPVTWKAKPPEWMEP